MGTHSIFVYGSLKRGHRHHRELRGARFVGERETAPAYRLLDFGDYPALARGDRSIMGELFEVDDELLSHLDEFEGADYRRALVELADASTAQAYFAVDGGTAGAREFDGRTWPDLGPGDPQR